MFGINAKPQHRVPIRKRTTCAPLTTDGYLKVTNRSLYYDETGNAPVPDELCYEWKYGSLKPFETGTTLLGSSFVVNRTKNYSMAVAWSHSQLDDLTRFSPIDSLSVPKRDVFILALSANGIGFRNESGDPIFAAHQLHRSLDPNTFDQTNFFVQDEPAGILGCTEQGEGPADSELPGLHLNDKQNVTAFAIGSAIQNWGTDLSLVAGAEPVSSQATEEVDAGASVGLPSDQWHVEFEGWGQFILATFQQVVASYAIGPPQVYSSLVTPPTTKEERELCGRQKMKASGGFK
ncbi:MAG: hypothetical protein Q9162_007600 [Coniocarpon cinnabarinum]